MDDATFETSDWRKQSVKDVQALFSGKAPRDGVSVGGPAKLVLHVLRQGGVVRFACPSGRMISSGRWATIENVQRVGRSRLRGAGLGILGVAVAGCTLFVEFVSKPTEAGCDGAACVDAVRKEDASETGGYDARVEASWSYIETILQDAPLAYWRFGETSGAIARDERDAYNGTYTGGVTLGAAGAIAGDTNGAATFDGDSGYVVVGPGAGLSFSGNHPYTLEAWVKPARTITEEERIMGRRVGIIGSSNVEGYRLTLYNDIVFDRYAGDRLIGEAKAVRPPLEKFTHVVATYDGSALSLYTDGSLSWKSIQATDPLPAIAADFVIAANSLKEDLYFRGTLDEVAVYGIALSAERIKEH